MNTPVKRAKSTALSKKCNPSLDRIKKEEKTKKQNKTKKN